MEKAFSPGFQHDIAELLDICLENHTDNITIDMQYPSGILEIELTFKVIQKEPMDECLQK